MGDKSHTLPFWKKYIFSTDHKMIGIQYTVTALCFMMVGLLMMLIMRWQLAYPAQPLPGIGGLFGDANAPGGHCPP